MVISRPRPALVARLLAASVVVGAATTPLAASAATPPVPPGVRPLGTTITRAAPSTVGALFPNGLGGRHGCSGTVVSIGGESVVLTAAHCITGSARGWRFAPGYDAGRTPYGQWVVEGAYVDPRWKATQSQMYDVAVLRIAKSYVWGASRNIGAVTGTALLANQPAKGVIVDITGYKSGRLDRALACSNRYTVQNSYGYTSCSWLPTGVSGSGLRYGNDGRGHQYVGGVLGGYHQGGCAPQDAYTSTLGAWTRALVQRALAGSPADTLSVNEAWDGCPTYRP